MFEITITNTNLIPFPANHIYQPDIIEPISMQFWLNPNTNLLEILNIQFISPEFVWNSVSDKLIEEWEGMHVMQFQFPTYNREMFFFKLTDEDKIKYQCIDAACFFAREYGKRLNNQRIIYYFMDEAENTINACIKRSQLNCDQINRLIIHDEYYLIGQLKVTQTHDELSWLDYLDIEADYQDEISKETMIKLAVEHLNLNAIPCVKYAEAYRFYLTEEEEQLMVNCLIKNIITCEMCYFSTNSSYQSAPSILSDDATDPERNSQILQQYNLPLPVNNEMTDIASPIGSPVLNGVFI